MRFKIRQIVLNTFVTTIAFSLGAIATAGLLEITTITGNVLGLVSPGIREFIAILVYAFIAGLLVDAIRLVASFVGSNAAESSRDQGRDATTGHRAGV